MKRCVTLFEDGTPAPKDYVMFITASLAYPANSSSNIAPNVAPYTLWLASIYYPFANASVAD